MVLETEEEIEEIKDSKKFMYLDIPITPSEINEQFTAVKISKKDIRIEEYFLQLRTKSEFKRQFTNHF